MSSPEGTSPAPSQGLATRADSPPLTGFSTVKDPGTSAGSDRRSSALRDSCISLTWGQVPSLDPGVAQATLGSALGVQAHLRGLAFL